MADDKSTWKSGNPAPPQPRHLSADDRPLDAETVLSNAELSRYGYRARPDDPERPSENTTVSDGKPKPDFWTSADKAMLGLCETLALLFGLPFGEDLYNDKPVTGLHGLYLAIGLLFAVTGPMWPWIRTRSWVSQTLVASLSRAPTNPYVWLTVLLVLFLYGTGPEIYQRAVPAAPTADEIADAVAHKLKSAPTQTQGLGFAVPTQIKVPSKNYSTTEKTALLDILGSISALLNDKGLLAVRIGRNNVMGTSKATLDEIAKDAQVATESLDTIKLQIWQTILPDNRNFTADLNYVIDYPNTAKLDQFQQATDQFLGQVLNFQRYLDSFNQDQRNWISGLIQQGAGLLRFHTADDFQSWIQQCNARIDAEREGLR